MPPGPAAEWRPSRSAGIPGRRPGAAATCRTMAHDEGEDRGDSTFHGRTPPGLPGSVRSRELLSPDSVPTGVASVETGGASAMARTMGATTIGGIAIGRGLGIGLIGSPRSPRSRREETTRTRPRRRSRCRRRAPSGGSARPSRATRTRRRDPPPESGRRCWRTGGGGAPPARRSDGGGRRRGTQLATVPPALRPVHPAGAGLPGPPPALLSWLVHLPPADGDADDDQDRPGQRQHRRPEHDEERVPPFSDRLVQSSEHLRAQVAGAAAQAPTRARRRSRDRARRRPAVESVAIARHRQAAPRGPRHSTLNLQFAVASSSVLRR